MSANDTRAALAMLVRNNMETEKVDGADIEKLEATQIDQQLLPLRMDLEILQRTYAENHPKVQIARMKLKMQQDLLLNRPSLEKGDSADFFDVYLQSLAERIENPRSAVAGLRNAVCRAREARPPARTIRHR